MRWSKSKPKKPGWYWYRSERGFVWIENIDLVKGELCTVSMKDGSTYRLRGYDGEWAGPLSPPEEP